MKEITRIHIAKTAYDIELAAKKDIEKYMAGLERYADDPELLSDIEIRITELLAERGVKAGGVIAHDDVVAVRAQLGEPSDFLPEGAGDIAVGASGLEDNGKRLFRDLDNAILGGVLAGLARYFSVNPLWTRLIFIVLLFASFGAALIVYLILWLVTPPARSAADKLRMAGQPVTLESIKRLGEQSEPVVNESAKIVKKVLMVGTGVVLVLLAVVSLLATIAIVASVSFGFGSSYSPVAAWGVANSWWFIAMMSLLVLSGVLFATLCMILAIATLRHQWSKRIGTAVVAITVAGLLSFIGGIGVAVYGNLDEQGRAYAARKTVSAELPVGFKGITSLTVASDKSIEGQGRIEYIVSDKPHYELESLPGVKPQFVVADDGLSATVKLVKTSSSSTYRPWEQAAMPVLRIYGPALESIEAAQNALIMQYTNPGPQAKIALTAHGESQLDIEGTYDTVTVTGEIGSMVTVARASVNELQVNGGVVQAGVVRTLTVRQPDACAAYAEESSDHYVRVQAVSSGKLSYNGVEQPAKTITNNCGKVVVGRELDDYDKEGEY